MLRDRNWMIPIALILTGLIALRDGLRNLPLSSMIADGSITLGLSVLTGGVVGLMRREPAPKRPMRILGGLAICVLLWLEYKGVGL